MLKNIRSCSLGKKSREYQSIIFHCLTLTPNAKRSIKIPHCPVYWVWLKQLIFPTAALTALWCGLGAREVLIIHRCFGYWWAALDNITATSPTPLLPISRLGGGQNLGMEHNLNSWPKLAKDICSDIKAKKKEEEGWGGCSLFTIFFYQSNHYTCRSPISWEVDEHYLLTGSRE